MGFGAGLPPPNLIELTEMNKLAMKGREEKRREEKRRREKDERTLSLR